MDFPLTAVFNFNEVELVLMAILLVPTIYVMVTGAPFVPTRMEQVDRMLKVAGIKKGMKVYDLGAGDGRLVHKASKEYGADAVGYEYSPLVWILSKILQPFWRSKAKLKFGNIWRQNVSDADVIVCYMMPGSMKRMEQDIFPQLKKGAVIVSHAFQIEGRKAWKSVKRDRERKLGPVWVYKI